MSEHNDRDDVDLGSDITGDVELEVIGDSEATAASESDPLAQLMAERDGLVTTLQHMQADFENLRKRMMRDQQVAIERASEGIVAQLLPVLDNFELAMTTFGAEGDHAQLDAEKVRKGIEMVFAEFVSVLEKAGLSRIVAEGTPFDPTQHEAVMEVAREDAHGGDEPVVVDIMRSGYVFKGRVLRPAMVKVAR